MFISAMNNIKPGVIHSILVGYQWKEFLLPNSVQFSSVPQLCPTLCNSMPNYGGPLDCKEIQPVHSKGDQSWVFLGSNDIKAETPVLWPPHVKS